MLPKRNRLTKKRDFNLVFKKGKSFKEDFLILKTFSNKIEDCRFGIIVSRKISKKAVARNKIKRKIRALIESKINKIEKGKDVVLIVLPGLTTKDFWKMGKTVNNLFKKAKLIKNVYPVRKSHGKTTK